MIHDTLSLIVGVIASHETFRIEDGVVRVVVGGVLGSVPTDTLVVG